MYFPRIIAVGHTIINHVTGLDDPIPITCDHVYACMFFWGRRFAVVSIWEYVGCVRKDRYLKHVCQCLSARGFAHL